VSRAAVNRYSAGNRLQREVRGLKTLWPLTEGRRTSESEPESELDDPTRERADDLVYRITREDPIPGLSVAVVDTTVDDQGPTSDSSHE
jgi:hypothetical protein